MFFSLYSLLTHWISIINIQTHSTTPHFSSPLQKKSHLIPKSPSTLFSFYKMDPYMDEKWKLSKRGSRNYSSSKREQPTSTSGSHLKRSSSMPETIKAHRRQPSSSATSTDASAAGRSSFSSRCANLVKEQRAKFYIMRRCVTMLMCWRDYPWFFAFFTKIGSFVLYIEREERDLFER